jgi:biotin carboxylase
MASAGVAIKRILILGASRYYVRSIAAAKALGLDVVAIDRNPSAEGFSYADHHAVVDITDAAAAIEIAKAFAVDGVLPLNDFGVRTAAAVSEALGLTGISREAAGWVTDKAAMRRKWDEAGVPSARWRTVDSVAGILSAAAELGTWPLVVKPSDSRGGGSRGVSVVASERDLPAAFDLARSHYHDGPVIIEEFLDGLEHSVETMTFEGETHVLAVSDKVKTPLPYRVDASVIYPSRLSGEALDRVHDVCRAAVRAVGISVGASHVELCSTPAGPRLFEIGARCGGGGTPDPIVPFSTGIDELQEAARIAVGDAPRNLVPLRRRGCVYRFLTPVPGRLTGVIGLDAVQKWPGILDSAVFVGPGDEVKLVRAGADRSGFVIAGGETREAAIALADAAERAIRFQYV